MLENDQGGVWGALSSVLLCKQIVRYGSFSNIQIISLYGLLTRCYCVPCVLYKIIGVYCARISLYRMYISLVRWGYNGEYSCVKQCFFVLSVAKGKSNIYSLYFYCVWGMSYVYEYTQASLKRRIFWWEFLCFCFYAKFQSRCHLIYF